MAPLALPSGVCERVVRGEHDVMALVNILRKEGALLGTLIQTGRVYSAQASTVLYNALKGFESGGGR